MSVEHQVVPSFFLSPACAIYCSPNRFPRKDDSACLQAPLPSPSWRANNWQNCPRREFSWPHAVFLVLFSLVMVVSTADRHGPFFAIPSSTPDPARCCDGSFWSFLR